MTLPNVGRPSTAPRRRCAYCYEPFVPYRNSNQKYCSRECSRKANARWSWTLDRELYNGQAIRSAQTAERAARRSVEIRRVKASDGKRYYARDADALLEEISESEQARPGLWYG